jgi:hypothetical protein
MWFGRVASGAEFRLTGEALESQIIIDVISISTFAGGS